MKPRSRARKVCNNSRNFKNQSDITTASQATTEKQEASTKTGSYNKKTGGYNKNRRLQKKSRRLQPKTGKLQQKSSLKQKRMKRQDDGINDETDVKTALMLVEKVGEPDTSDELWNFN